MLKTCRIVNKTEDMISEPCVDGEIWVKALYPMLGYFENDAATEAAFALGGWIRTGDVGHFTREGLYYITDRLKDMIKVRGWQVSPAELEDVLMMHPDIIDAAVIGAALPEPSTEEEIHAFIVARPDSGLDEAAVKQFMRERLARFKIASDVFFMKELPRNPTGKIVRRNLKTVYAAFVVEEEKRKYFEQRRIPDFAPPIVHEVIGNEHGTDCTCIKCENGDKENRAEEAV